MVVLNAYIRVPLIYRSLLQSFFKEERKFIYNRDRSIDPMGTIPILFLLASIVLNGYYFQKTYFQRELTWTKKAAENAEAVAALTCSGHGTAYIDGDIIGGRPICECSSCYEGIDCSYFNPDCSVEVDGGNMTMYEAYFKGRAEETAVVTSGWHRMSYNFRNGLLVNNELDKVIRKLHADAKNAVTDGKYIIIGVGSIQLLNAAVHALSLMNFSASPYPSNVVAKAPFYPAYKTQTDFLRTPHYKFIGDPTKLNFTNITGDVFEFVASPSNPVGDLESPFPIHNPNIKAHHISDRVYYWPPYTAIPKPADDDIMLFSFSKLTGHAGSRLGWGLIKDVNVYNRMRQYIETVNVDISKDSLLRALTIFKDIVEDDGKKFFSSTTKVMRDRWKKMNDIFSLSKRFSIQTLPIRYCSYLGRNRGPSPVFAWVHCKLDKNCAQVFENAKIKARAGSRFFVGDDYVRIHLAIRQDDFDLLVTRLQQLIAQEEEIATL